MSDEAVAVTKEPEFIEPKKNFIKFISSQATVRIIRTDEWPITMKSKDIPKFDLIWDMSNHWTITKDGISDEAIKVLEGDGGFVISEK